MASSKPKRTRRPGGRKPEKRAKREKRKASKADDAAGGAPPALGSWDDVDRLLARLAQLQARQAEIQAEADERIRAVREAAAARLGPLAEERKALEAEIERFAASRRDEFGRRRSRQLAHGRIGWRTVERIAWRRGLKADDVVEALEARGLGVAVITSKRPSKEVLATFGDHLLEDIGVRRRRTDRFFCEPAGLRLDTP